MPAADGSATAAAFDDLIDRCRKAAPEVVQGGALLVEKFAKLHASGPHGPHTLGVETGRLRASITASLPYMLEPDLWEARTAPHVIYGRIQELGGHIFVRHFLGGETYTDAHGHVHPVGEDGVWGYLSWIGPDGQRYYKRHVYLPPRPYLGPGADDAIVPYQQLVYTGFGKALGVL